MSQKSTNDRPSDQPTFEQSLEAARRDRPRAGRGRTRAERGAGAVRRGREAAAAVVRPAATGRTADRTAQRRRRRGQPDHPALRRHGHLRLAGGNRPNGEAAASAAADAAAGCGVDDPTCGDAGPHSWTTSAWTIRSGRRKLGAVRRQDAIQLCRSCQPVHRNEHVAPLRFAELAQSLGPRIDAALAARTDLGDGCPPRLREAMRYSLLAPGKRLRPMLVLLAAEACGGSIDAAMPAACAVEMIHAYSLIHDDLPAMDDDDLRRGRPTCHKAFDEATAILAGDALLTLAFEVLGHARSSRRRWPRPVAPRWPRPPGPAAWSADRRMTWQGEAEWERGRRGEWRDTSLQHSPHLPLSPSPPLAHLESIHRRKTGAMIRVSLRLGAMVAGANAAATRRLGRLRPAARPGLSDHRRPAGRAE